MINLSYIEEMYKKGEKYIYHIWLIIRYNK